jgi:hypothetical protein
VERGHLARPASHLARRSKAFGWKPKAAGWKPALQPSDAAWADDEMKKADIEQSLLYGVVAEFDSTEKLLRAARRVRDAGYKDTDAFTPFPVHGLIEALGARRSRLAGLILIGGTVGCLVGFLLQYWVSVIHYPHVVSGRPYFSWPNFIPIIFECTVLFAAFTAVIGMMALNGLPKPYHPIFSAPRIEGCSTDKFMLFVKSTDALFDLDRTSEFLRGLGSDHVTAIHAEPSGTGQ